MTKAPKTYKWTLTKQQWALFEDALRQQQAGQLRLNDVMQSIAAAFGVELSASMEIVGADTKARSLTLRAT